MEATASAQAAKLDEAAKVLKRAIGASREALHAVRQVQAELNGTFDGIQVETIPPAKPTHTEAQHGTTEDSNQA